MGFLKRVQILELNIDEYLNLVSESGILFDQVINYFLDHHLDYMEEKCNRIRSNERSADEYRQNIEQHLYRHTLIPENRGDVLAILENTDRVINQIKKCTQDILIEKPDIPDFLHHPFKELVKTASNSVDELIKSVRAFFHDIHSVNDYAHKVFFYEKEADDLGEKVRKEIFSSNLELARKMEIKQLEIEIEKVSDYAQAVCDRLIIYTIKRQM